MVNSAPESIRTVLESSAAAGSANAGWAPLLAPSYDLCTFTDSLLRPNIRPCLRTKLKVIKRPETAVMDLIKSGEECGFIEGYKKVLPLMSDQFSLKSHKFLMLDKSCRGTESPHSEVPVVPFSTVVTVELL